jgi:hypothetical protein
MRGAACVASARTPAAQSQVPVIASSNHAHLRYEDGRFVPALLHREQV